jgi:hypothetical protein
MGQWAGHGAVVRTWGIGLDMGQWPGHGVVAWTWGGGLDMGSWPGHGAETLMSLHQNRCEIKLQILTHEN